MFAKLVVLFSLITISCHGFDPNDFMDQQIREEEERGGIQMSFLQDMESKQNASFQKVRLFLLYCV
jgi:hypothetical protein